MKNPDDNGLVELQDTTTDEALTMIQDSVKAKHRRRMIIEIATSGGSVIAFDQFAVEGRVKEGVGTWNTIVNAWGAASGTMIYASTDLAALAHGTSGMAIVDVHGFAEIRVLSAQAGITGSAVTRTLKLKFVDEKGGA